MFLIVDQDKRGRRIYRDLDTGQVAYSVTTIAQDVTSPDEASDYAHVPIGVLTMHRLEGEGCHTAALNWLAFTHQLIPSFTPPPKPALHPDERRWCNVIANAVQGMQQWCEARAVVPLAIEQPSANWQWGIAGTPDLKCELTWRKARVRAVVDLKFTASITRTHRCQVRLYRRLEGFEDCRLGFIVRIDRMDGAVEPVPIFWEDEMDLDARALCCAGRWR